MEFVFLTIGGCIGVCVMAIIAGSKENEQVQQLRRQMKQQCKEGYRAGWNGALESLSELIDRRHTSPRGEVRCRSQDIQECVHELLEI